MRNIGMNFHSKPHTYVGQVHLLVSDLERSITFYKEMIGFQVLEQTKNQAVLTADGTTPLLTIEQPEGVQPKQPRTTGLYHFALLLPNRKELAKVLLHLLQNRYPMQGASDHSVSEALYLADPDGNGIEIYRDRPADMWNWQDDQVFMDTRRLDVESLLAEAEGEAWTGLPKETVMGHIHLHVADLRATEEFYIQALGFDIVLRYGPQALFTSTGRYHHHIGLNVWNGVGAPAPKPNSVGMKYFTLLLPNEESRVATVARLQQLGAYVVEKNGIAITRDPSGNEVHLLV